MRKSRRAVGVLLALVLVLPAPALTACEGGQLVRNVFKRVGPGVGVGGVGGAGWCYEKC